MNCIVICCDTFRYDMLGHPVVKVPNLDRLAARGVRYTHAFSHAGVCAPSRSGLITGMYPTSLGSHHMRCTTTLPEEVKCFPEYLREAGYFCTNQSKTDYNFPVPPEAWDVPRGAKAHWRRRGAGQPFMSVFNLTITHESRIRAEYEQLEHDPAAAVLPPYLPDTPLVRRDWARYHDLVTQMDAQAGHLLEQLEEDGLADETIVFFFSDHGVGLPRAKQWIYDAGTHVPLIVYFPEKYRHLAPAPPGSAVDRLVSDGILIKEKNRRARVKDSAETWLVQIHQLREIVEPSAARLAAKYMPDEAIAKLEEYAELSMPGLSDTWLQAAREFDFVLHRTIADYCRNMALRETIHKCWNFKRISYQLGCSNPELEEIGHREHLAILSALSQHDPDTAYAAMLFHLRSSFNYTKIRQVV